MNDYGYKIIFLCLRSFECICIKTAFKPTNTLNQTFTQLKTKIDKNDKCNVVYEIPCECGQIYIGHTQNRLRDRLKTHESNIRCKNPKTALATHCITNNHLPTFTHTKILEIEKNRRKREFLESASIYAKRKSAVNARRDTQFLHNSYKHVINTYTFKRSQT